MHLDGVRGKEETVPRIQDNNEIEKIPVVGSGPACPKILAVCGWCFWRGTSHNVTTFSHNPSRFMLGQRRAARAATATFACQHLPNLGKQPPECEWGQKAKVSNLPPRKPQRHPSRPIGGKTPNRTSEDVTEQRTEFILMMGSIFVLV